MTTNALRGRTVRRLIPACSTALAALRRWPDWAAPAALAWSVGYGALAAFWALGGGGFPFGEGDREAADMGSLFVDLRAGVLAPAIAGFCALIAVVAAAMVRGVLPRRLALAAGWTTTAILLMAIPDVRLLRDFAYFFAGFVGFAKKVDWPAANQALCLGGGILWGAATLAYQRRARAACTHCGVEAGAGSPAQEEVVWRRRGRRFMLAAALLPVPYELTRWSWALGWPVGVTTGADAIRDWPLENRIGMLVMGGLPLVGGVLTHGLDKAWGEVVPRWVPRLAGRPIPLAAVVAPAAIVSLLIVIAATSLQRFGLNVALDRVPPAHADVEGWGAWAPGLVFLPWGLALAAATYAYWRRRRGRCVACAEATHGDVRAEPLPGGRHAAAASPA